MSSPKDEESKQYIKVDGKVDRREFFKVLFSETVALFDEINGQHQLQLSDLWDLPDERLAQIKPVVLPKIDIVPTEGKIRAWHREKKEFFDLFDRESSDMFIFNRFNGLTTIGQIGADLAKTLSWDERQGFAHAKNLFLHLVNLRVCAPGNPIE